MSVLSELKRRGVADVFILEDVEPSPRTDSERDRVNMYGYASMAVAALQQHEEQIEVLRAEIATLRAALASWAVCEAPR